MIIYDAHVWIAALNTEDSQHAKALPLFTAPRDRILLPEYVITEVCSVLALKAEKKEADIFLERIADNADIQILLTDRPFLDALFRFFRRDPHVGLSFIDVALLFFAQTYEVITFDTKLARAIRRQRSG